MTDGWRHDELGWLPDEASVEPAIGEQVWSELSRGLDPQSALAAALAYQASEPEAAPNAIGIDVSSWQGQPDWAAVAATRQFVYIKAGEGNGTSYPTLDSQYRGARAAGLVTGLYWFAQPSLSPEANADAFSAQVTRLGTIQGHLPPCLDLEVGAGDLSGWAKAFIDRLRANTGCVRVMVYSSASFFAQRITESWMDPNIALWIAHFNAPPGKPSYLTPRVAIHQYSNVGQVAGIAGNVDLDFAIWPISKLIPSEVELDARQDAMLTAAYQQLSGSAIVGQWPGWPTWPGGSNQSLTLVDYARQNNVDITELKADVAAIKAALPQAPSAAAAGTQLSDADVARIAAAVVGLLGGKLSR